MPRKGAAARAGAPDTIGELLHLHRRLLGPIGVVDPSLPFVERDRMLANALLRRRIQDAQPKAADIYGKLSPA
jgi:hypothetical protein